MVLVTGPTGSGKTVTLYTALNILNTIERNISTVEDPVEINLPGINQVNINLKAGLTFASALRSFLRQDPDIIMVGEIRDLETAEIGIKAAQTGHMVLSTLHTNSAPETLTRLVNMGVAPFNIASSVSLIIAQRLARRLCNHCKRVEKIPKESLLKEGFQEQEIAGLTVYGPVGCEHCTGGYKGRVGLYEVMPVSEDIGRLHPDRGPGQERGRRRPAALRAQQGHRRPHQPRGSQPGDQGLSRWRKQQSSLRHSSGKGPTSAACASRARAGVPISPWSRPSCGVKASPR